MTGVLRTRPDGEEAGMVAAAARRLHVSAHRLVGWLRLRSFMHRTIHQGPAWVRVGAIRALLRMGYRGPVTLVPPDELQRCFRSAMSLLPGGSLTYLEFGVYVGTSMIAMAGAARAAGRRVDLIGFDSFEGLPPSAAEESEGFFHAGQLHSAMDVTRANLRRHEIDPRAVRLIAGWFEESLTPERRLSLGSGRADIVMIDCDLESSARLALDFCTPLFDRTVIFFDDWDIQGWGRRGLGEARAFERWRSGHPEFGVEDRPELRYRDGERARAFLITRKGNGRPGTPSPSVAL